MSASVVLCISVLSFQAFSGFRTVHACRVRMGVFIFFEALMSSSKRGTPRVTFLAEFPAWWKVFKVICVVGSPTDCAAMVPTISPGATME